MLNRWQFLSYPMPRSGRELPHMAKVLIMTMAKVAVRNIVRLNPSGQGRVIADIADPVGGGCKSDDFHSESVVVA